MGRYPDVEIGDDGRTTVWHPSGGCTVFPKGVELTDELKEGLHRRAETNNQFYPPDYDIDEVSDPRQVDGEQTILHRESGDLVRVDLLTIAPGELVERCGIPPRQRDWVLDACREYLSFKVGSWERNQLPDRIPLLDGWLWIEHPSGGCSVLPPGTDVTEDLVRELDNKAEFRNFHYPPGFKNGMPDESRRRAERQKVRHRQSGEWVEVNLLAVTAEELVERCGIPESHREIVVEACRKHLELSIEYWNERDIPDSIPLLQDGR